MPPDVTAEKPYRLPKPWIKEQAEKHLQRTDKPRYRRLKSDGKLDEYLDEKYGDVKDFAESLIYCGNPPEQAWHWAVRTQILGLDMD